MKTPPADASGKKEEKNAIFVDRIQAETIRKELRVHHVYEKYMMSPAIKSNLVITNTPQRMSVNSNEEKEDEEYIQFSQKNSLTPRDKQPYPVTSSQEYGWDTDQLFRSTDGRFYHPRRETEISLMYKQKEKII
ncbi:hypothetical protein HK101_011064 [Irineochytrium annulatum]|nr:hypothetical protein HK101_011064 [Irineochytrium annulatum]